MRRKRSKEQLPLQPLPQFTGDNSQARVEEILRAIDNLNSRVLELSPGKNFSDRYLDIINNAQIASNNKNWNEAYRQIWSATFLINRGIESLKNRGLAIKLAFTPLITFAVLAIIQLLLTWSTLPPVLGKVLSGTNLQYLWTGALGGTTIAWWGIVKHTILMDFDDQYKAWYWFKPLLGAIFGMVSVIIIKGGLISLHVQPNVTIHNTEVLHIIAFLAGFSERFFLRLIDRVMTALFGGEREEVRPRLPDVYQSLQPKPKEGKEKVTDRKVKKEG